MRALVTGSNGFVGRHICERLLKDGYTVYTCDINSYDPMDCREYFKQKSLPEFDIIVHLAAIVGGRVKIDGDPLSVATDLSIDAEFFNWVASLNYSPHVFYFSSSAAYPVYLQDSKIILKESDINFSNLFMPDMTYGWAKLTGEFLAKLCVEKYGKRISVFRPFSGYGPGQDLDYPFPSILKRVINKERPVNVWGTGDQVRDFIYIGDILDGMFLIGEQNQTANPVNLSTGMGTSFNELARLMWEVVHGNYDIEILNDLTKPAGVKYRVGDTSLQTKYGFKPKVDLIKGIELCLKSL